VTTSPGHGPIPSRDCRVEVLPEAERSTRQQEVVDDLVVGPTVNIYATIVRNPEAAAAMVNLGRTLRAGRLSARHREVLILRTGCNCGSAYELAQHYRIGVGAGMTDADMERISQGPDAAGWDGLEAALCRAADELHVDHVMSDATWSTLADAFDEPTLIEILMFVGYYHLVSMVLNSLGVPLEEGAKPFPYL
jgi:4-carboxymuconolactone decarboxylase